MARPSDFTPEIVNAILLRIMEGESLRQICETEGMPSKTTVMRWLAADTEFCDQYRVARELQAESMFDELIQIADDCTDDIMFLTEDDSTGESGRAVIKHSAIQRARLRIDARKWLMGKMAPKKYGDKIQNEITGKDGGPVEMTSADHAIIAQTLALLKKDG